MKLNAKSLADTMQQVLLDIDERITRCAHAAAAGGGRSVSAH